MAWDDLDDDDTGFDATDPDDESTAPCPACGAEIYDDAERCPECGHYQSREDQRRSATPVWIIATAVLCLVIVVLWIISGIF
jgi:predicted nucleic acid-binding Zn ribbon protein